MSSRPRAPKSLETAGRRLWASVTSEFDLAEHELALLRQACHTADLCDELQAEVERDGPILAAASGRERTHPAVVELRNQRLLLARLVAMLRVPLGDEDAGRLPGQVRAIRGVYRPRAVAGS
jgi:hypothetical protein